MSILLNVNWIALLALTTFLLLFLFLHELAERLNWTLVILISLVLGATVGLVFASEDNSYLVWIEMIGRIYVNAITALAAPVILISIISSFISLKNGNLRGLGVRSVVWLMISAIAAILFSIAAGIATNIGGNAASVFADIGGVSNASISAYDALRTSFDEVIAGLFPSNIVTDIGSNNIVAIIVIAAAIALAYNAVAHEGEAEAVAPFGKLIDALRKIVYKILEYVIDLTPYAVLCLVAGSASSIFTNRAAILQLLLLVLLIYAVCLFHIYIFNGILIRAAAKLSPVRFFRKIFGAQVIAFTTQSSVGSLPTTIRCLRNGVGVDEEVANFTAPLGTTIGMPGCTCVWPILLALFYIHSQGIAWGISDYCILAVFTFVLSFGSAGVPGIAVVSALALFSALGLPIAAVILLMPINTISDMIRTATNVTAAATSSAIVARKEGRIDDSVFQSNGAFKQGGKQV